MYDQIINQRNAVVNNLNVTTDNALTSLGDVTVIMIAMMVPTSIIVLIRVEKISSNADRENAFH